jgi:hypothetical protein
MRTQQSRTADNHERKKLAYLSLFCNIQQHPETGVVGLWL